MVMRILISRHSRKQCPMSHGTQHEIWNPFGERLDTNRAEREIAQAWAYYINGGGGDPYYFDYLAWLKNAERQHSR
jgi:hypothetical protein